MKIKTAIFLLFFAICRTLVASYSDSEDDFSEDKSKLTPHKAKLVNISPPYSPTSSLDLWATYVTQLKEIFDAYNSSSEISKTTMKDDFNDLLRKAYPSWTKEAVIIAIDNLVAVKSIEIEATGLLRGYLEAYFSMEGLDEDRE